MDGLQLGMDSGSVLDLSDCPHTVLVLLQLLAERGGGLAQVFDCCVQVLDRVQGASFQIIHRLHDFGKVTGGTFYLRPTRPVAALLIAEVEVVHQKVGKLWLLGLFQCIQKELLLFGQVCDPALQTADGAADGLHQAVGCTNIPIEISEKGFNSSFFHLVCGRAEMDGRNLLHTLTFKRTEINTFRSASGFKITVGDDFPAVPPYLGILLVVPVYCVFLVAFPVAGWKLDALSVFVKVVNLAGFREQLAVFIHCPDCQQNVGVWVPIALVMDGEVSNHAFGNKLLIAKFFEHRRILVFRNFSRKCQHDAASKLRVPLILHGFHCVPERCPVCISGRHMGRQHDLGMDEFFLLVVKFCFLVVLAE